MKVVLAPNAFKECLSAPAVAAAMARGARRAGGVDIVEVPVGDGGDGTLEALVAATGGEVFAAEVADPLGRMHSARYGMLGDGETAVIEMAEASGLRLLRESERDPRKTSTFGTGQLLLAAMECGARKVIAGIGGSATNDGGAGMAEALGFRLLDARGKPLPPGGAALNDLATIDASGADTRLKGLEVKVACDVKNPLYGEDGAAAVYGPQKGATPEMVEELDRGLRRFAEVVERDLGVSIADVPGSGAAGGLGGGMCAFLAAELVAGIDLVLAHAGLEEALHGADLVITGEGAIDDQTAMGKAPAGVAAMAKRQGVPVVALAGILRDGYRDLHEHGIDALFAISRGPADLEYHMKHAARLIEEKTEEIVRLFQAARS